MNQYMQAAISEAQKGLDKGGIPLVVIGENKTYLGEEELLRSRGVEVEVLQDEACIALMKEFISANPEIWNEDIGKE